MSTALAHAQQSPVSTTSSPNLTASVLMALSRWNPSATLPEGLSSSTLQSAIDEQRQKLRPPASGEISSACKALLMHAKVIGMKEQPEAGELHAVWSAHCRDMPAT